MVKSEKSVNAQRDGQPAQYVIYERADYCPITGKFLKSTRCEPHSITDSEYQLRDSDKNRVSVLVPAKNFYPSPSGQVGRAFGTCC